jgi:hypothetical protein
MRNQLVLVGLVALSACSGGGPETAGSTAAPVGASAVAASPSTDKYTEFVKPITAKTYVGIGGSQVYTYKTDDREVVGQQAQLYAGNAGTVRASAISVGYDPRDGIYTLKVTDTASGANTDMRFQDPAHRTNFGGASEPQWGVPNLPDGKNVRYLQTSSGNGVVDFGTNTIPANGEKGSSTTSTTFFFEVPGTTTKFVSYAGYIRNDIGTDTGKVAGVDHVIQSYRIERGAFAYGAQTENNAVPKTGTGSYTGSMLATMVNNPTLDNAGASQLPSYFQWIQGTSKVDVNFAANTVGVSLAGTVTAPAIDRFTAPTTSVIPAGASFSATGSAAIDLVNKGGFSGTVSGVTFKNAAGATIQQLSQPAGVFDSTKAQGVIAGSSLDGAFYGPGGAVDKVEVGGGFRVVGGTPDQRIDIIGAFTAGTPGQ